MILWPFSSASMKKTLIVTLEYPPQIGGIATYVHELALALGSANITVLAPCHQAAADWDTDLPYRVIRKRLLLPRFFWPRWIPLLWHVLLVAKGAIGGAHPSPAAGRIRGCCREPPDADSVYRVSPGTDFISSIRTSWKAKMANLVTGGQASYLIVSRSMTDLRARFLQSAERRSYPSCRLVLRSAAGETLERLRSRYALHGKR